MSGQPVGTGSISVSYKYGLLAPIDWGDDCEEEISLQTVLWNKLVELENSYRQHVRALEREDLNVVQLENDRLAIDTKKEALLAQRNAARRAARRKIATPDIDRQLLDVSSQLAAVVAQHRGAQRFIHKSRQEQLRLLNAERYRAVSQARRESGLFWSNYNAVIGDYEVARRQTIRKGVDLGSVIAPIVVALPTRFRAA